MSSPIVRVDRIRPSAATPPWGLSARLPMRGPRRGARSPRPGSPTTRARRPTSSRCRRWRELDDVGRERVDRDDALLDRGAGDVHCLCQLPDRRAGVDDVPLYVLHPLARSAAGRIALAGDGLVRPVLCDELRCLGRDCGEPSSQGRLGRHDVQAARSPANVLVTCTIVRQPLGISARSPSCGKNGKGPCAHPVARPFLRPTPDRGHPRPFWGSCPLGAYPRATCRPPAAIRGASSIAIIASTTSASHCVPRPSRRISIASRCAIAGRYGRLLIIAWKASATATTRASNGICSPLRPSG